jgi:hypothetical protein
MGPAFRFLVTDGPELTPVSLHKLDLSSFELDAEELCRRDSFTVMTGYVFAAALSSLTTDLTNADGGSEKENQTETTQSSGAHSESLSNG